MEDKDLSGILESGLRNGALTDKEVENIQVRLLVLLGRRTERYTMGDSSSVPIETAEELFRSICFTISQVLKSDHDMSALLDCDDIEAILKEGQKKIQRLVEIGKWLLRKAKEGALPIENISYQDTILSIEGFFKKYDIQFFAHVIPCSIDYQLCHAVPEELQGIKYINEYLRRIVLENRFCSGFDSGKIIKLLEAYCPDYRELLINIYEPVATNALGIALLSDYVPGLDVICSDVPGLDVICSDVPGLDVICSDVPGLDVISSDVPGLDVICSDVPGLDVICSDVTGLGVTCTAVTSLDVTEEDSNRLLRLFQHWDEGEMIQNLRQAAVRVSNALRITDASDIEYLKSTAESLCPRIRAVLPTQRLDGIFISLSLHNTEG